MIEALKTIEYRGYTIKIYQDEGTENPIQEWDMLGEFVCWHRRYNLGNSKRFDNPDELKAYAKKTRSILIPLYMYEHSGIALSLSNDGYPFNDRWDAGQLGYVLIDRKKALKEYNAKIFTKALKDKAIETIRKEVELYNEFLRGEVYRFVIENKKGEMTDSCGGCYGLEEIIEEVKLEIDNEIKNVIKEHCQKVKNWIKYDVPLGNRKKLSAF